MYPYNLRILLKPSEHLLSQRVNNLSIYTCVLDVAVFQVIRNILYPTSGFKHVHGENVCKKGYKNNFAEGLECTILGTL
jgi:hypothetical protein